MTDKIEEMRALTPTQEDYLEVIFRLIEKNRVARNKDIADMLGVKRATVTGAIKSLAEKGLVNYESHGFITFTDDGRAISGRLVEKHELCKTFFFEILGLEETEAEDVACRIEHAIEGEALEKFRELIERIIECKSDDKFNNEKCSACGRDV